MKLNRIIMSIAAVGLLFAATPAVVQANGTSTQVTWNVDGTTLIIDGTGIMADCTEDEVQPWVGFKDVIESVEIKSGVTSVGDRAFENYTNIKSISLPDSIKSIGEYAFAGTAIETITIPEDVYVIEAGAFQNCYSMYEVKIEGSFTDIQGGGITIPSYVEIYGYAGTYTQRYTEDYGRSFIEMGPGLMIDIAGFQISSKVKGVRTMYSTNISKFETEEVGIIYGMPYNGKDPQEEIDYKYTSQSDMVLGSDNFFVHSYPATSAGSSAKIYSDFDDTRSYVMTMTFGEENAQYYNAKYYVRAYAKLSSGRTVYSRVYQYTVRDVAEVLYTAHQMNSETDHEFLYNILKTVDPDYPETDWKWDTSGYGGDEITVDGYEPSWDSYVSISAFQISTSVKGIRTLFSVRYDDSEIESKGVVYGLVNSVNDLTADLIVGSTNCGVMSYESTDAGRIDVGSIGSDLYTMTLLFDEQSVESLTKEYYVRAYVKLKDGTYVYSDVSKYSVYSVADYLYQNSEMYSYSDHNYIYDNILKKVDCGYEEVEYFWMYMITENVGIFRPEIE